MFRAGIVNGPALSYFEPVPNGEVFHPSNVAAEPPIVRDIDDPDGKVTTALGAESIEVSEPEPRLLLNCTRNVPVAENVTGDPESPLDVAVRLLLPPDEPSVQEPTEATPEPFVVADSPDADPPPVTTANVTDTPLTGFPPESLITTAGALATWLPADALCELPVETAIDVAVPVVTEIPV